MTQTWFVTTAHSPIGRQLATQLLEHGDRVITTARNPLLLEDLKTAHATTLTIYTADDTNIQDLNEAVTRAFTEHTRIDAVAGPEPLATAALPHLVAQGGGRIIRPPDQAGTQTTVTVTVAARQQTQPDAWPRDTVATSRNHGNHTSLSEEQLGRLQPGMWGQPPTIANRQIERG